MLPRRVRSVRVLCVIAGLILSTFVARQSSGADKKKSKALTPAEVFKRAAPAVVAIDCLGDNNAIVAMASGFILSDNGKIATNFHVIKACKSLSVRLTNGDVYDMTWVIAFDVRRDIALIKIKAASLPTLPLAESNDIEIGDMVYSLGNPKGLQNTLQQGLVSAFREVNGSRLVQVAASINPGNSGGPILNEQGGVVAIAVAKITEAENLGFAIPIDYLKGYLDSKEETAFPVFAAAIARASGTAVASAPSAKAGLTLPDTATTSIAPIFSQLLAFTLPRGFRPAAEKVNDPTYIQQAILAGETLQQWTQMITVLAFKGPASNPLMSPKTFFEATARGIREHCPNSFGSANLFDGKINGRDGFVGVASCGTSAADAARSETVLMTNIKGDNDYYSLLWTERAQASSTPIPVDTQKWLERFKALAPIALCPIVPGESLPYPSCLDKIASDAREALAHAKELLDQKRFSEALALFEQSGSSGNAEAQRYAGDAYRNGLGVTQDYKQARQWYEKAAAKGDLTAANGLGVLYFKGQGGAEDDAQARSLFEKAAAAGKPDAIYNLGWALQRAQDYAQARQWYEKGASVGQAGCMAQLGYLYERGLGVAQDFAQARQWYERAAAGGNATGMNNLGVLYQSGRGVGQDYTQARQWFEKAAATGNSAAMNNLGQLYEHGLGGAVDFTQARQWYEKAVAAGNPAAKANLEKLPK